MSTLDVIRQLADIARTLSPIVAGPDGARVVAVADQLGRTLEDLRDMVVQKSTSELPDIASINADISALRERVNAHARDTLASLEAKG